MTAARNAYGSPSRPFAIAAALVLAGTACGESQAPASDESGGSAAVVGGMGGAQTGGTPSTGGATGKGGSAGAAIGGAGNAGTPGKGVGGSAGGAGGASAIGGGVGGASAGDGGTSGGVAGGASAGQGGSSTGGAGGGSAAEGGVGGNGAGGASAGQGGKAGGAGGASAGQGSGGASGGVAGATGGVAGALCPSGITRTITVAKSGAEFTSVQAAVDSIQSGSSERIRIDIGAGTYEEKLTIASRTNLCLVGAGAMSTILTYDDSSATVGSTSGSASVHISANDFSAANLSIENGYGTGSQAVALRVTGQRQQFLNCRFVGYQDTLYTHSGVQYFRDCYVQGNVDYVFGGATAVLQNCEVRNVEGGSAVTAPSTDAAQPYGIVFLGGRLTAVGSVSANSVALGRPWGADGSTAYLNVELGAHVSSAGFVVMGENDPMDARFREYESTGPGANPGAHSSYQMSASEAADYTLSEIFGDWTPSYSE